MAEIPLLEPFLGGNERKYVEEALAANQPSVGPFVERFEQAFAEYVGSRHAVAVSSGTAALHLAMRILDVGPGDEVLVPTFSFVATVNPILYQGAAPVLVDAEPKTWGMDPALVSHVLNTRALRGEKMPKAAIVAHLYGHPASEAIAYICEAHGVPLVEDATESLGATVNDFSVGTFGKVGCFSFNGNKIITTGQGGMLVTDDEALASRARHLRAQARLPGPGYAHDDVGFNYRMPNLSASIGLAQLEQIDQFIARKRAIATTYRETMRLPDQAGAGHSTSWLYSVRVPDPAGLRESLSADGIESRPVWTPLHTMQPYRGFHRIGGTVAEALHASGLSLPSSVGLGEAQKKVISAVRKELTRAAA